MEEEVGVGRCQRRRLRVDVPWLSITFNHSGRECAVVRLNKRQSLAPILLATSVFALHSSWDELISTAVLNSIVGTVKITHCINLCLLGGANSSARARSHSNESPPPHSTLHPTCAPDRDDKKPESTRPSTSVTAAARVHDVVLLGARVQQVEGVCPAPRFPRNGRCRIKSC